MLWDVKDQKLYGFVLVGFVVSEIKSRIPAQGERMTKAEEFDKARRLAYKGDFSLVEKLYHPDCKSFDHRVGMEVNLDMQNALVPIYDCRFGPMKPLYENFECLSIHRYVKVLDREVIYWSVISVLNYLDGKIIRHTSAVETLDYDPSENQDWNWEDYE